MDLYGPLLAKAIFPALEAVRGRPTVPLLRYLQGTERLSLGELRDLQTGLLRRLLRHAHAHTAFYRRVLDEHGLRPSDVKSVDDLARLPLLDRETRRATMAERTSDASPLPVIRKTSGSSEQSAELLYSAESGHWRGAIRWRGYGWGGYQIGMRALHYRGLVPAASTGWWRHGKLLADRLAKRDLYLDCTPRGEEALACAVRAVERFRPDVIIAYASGAGALARYVNDQGLRRWNTIPVLTGAEALRPDDREAISRAFGPAFETYGCRELMVMAAECEAHAGMHASMENLIVELIVREPDGTVRAARPGELGEVVLTDLHNLACPMIRYVNGDLAVARGEAPCTCGRGLARIGPVRARSAETSVVVEADARRAGTSIVLEAATSA